MRLARLAPFVVLLAAGPADDAFDLAVQALAVGSRAADAGDPARLRAAALDLRASAAVPVDGHDLAARWLRAAHAAPPPPDRNRALGPGYRSLALRRGEIARFEQTFLAGQRARVTVVPTRRSDFAMRVTNDERAIVCQATARHARCDWVPSYTTRFNIEMRNSGRESGQYYLILQ